VVTGEGRREERVLCGLVGKGLIVRDELPGDLLDLDHVAELDLLAGVAAFEQLRMRLEETEELLVIGDGLSLQDTAPRLVHHTKDKLPGARDLLHEGLGQGALPRVVATGGDALGKALRDAKHPLAQVFHTPVPSENAIGS